MKRILFLLTILTSLSAQAERKPYAERAAEYVRRHKDWAIAEQKRSGVPAAITLAQGIHETDAGESELATMANNHFGIKCKKEWMGETFAHDDDAPQECFRKYGSALESYKDHSDYLKTSKRYASCFALQTTDYAGWARELRKCGYATNPVYAQKLVKLIEDFHLQDYTLAAMRAEEVTAPQVFIASAASPVAAAMMADEKHGEVVPEHDTPAEAREYGKVVKKDGLKGFWARSGDVLLEYAIQYKVRYAKLLEINNLPDAPLAADKFIYLEKGGAVERMIAKDVSAPAIAPVSEPSTPVIVSAPEASTATDKVSTPADKINTPAATGSAVDATAEAEARLFGTPTQKQAQPQPAAPAPVSASSEKPVNIANEQAVEEQKAPEPQDEFSRMKSRFDKVVYAPAKTTASGRPAPAATAAVAPEKIPASSASPIYHTVKTGDTAFGIAKANGLSMQQLMDLNKLSFGSAIKVGQKLRVK